MTKFGVRHASKKLPVGALRDVLRGFHMELMPCAGALALTVQGVVHILSFCREEVELRCGRRIVRVCGEDMEISVFENRAVRIYGRIKEILLV